MNPSPSAGREDSALSEALKPSNRNPPGPGSHPGSHDFCNASMLGLQQELGNMVHSEQQVRRICAYITALLSATLFRPRRRQTGEML
jgi:hypothetical protein